MKARTTIARAVGLGLVALSSCEPELPPDDQPAPDAAADASKESQCPRREPLLGSPCPLSSGLSVACTFMIATCGEGDARRTYQRSYCCELGQWEPCGDSVPCDDGPDAAADVPVDAAPDAGADTGADGSDPDSVPDGPVCEGVPAPMVCGRGAACTPCPGAPAAPCTCLGSWFCQVCPDAGAD